MVYHSKEGKTSMRFLPNHLPAQKRGRSFLFASLALTFVMCAAPAIPAAASVRAPEEFQAAQDLRKVLNLPAEPNLAGTAASARNALPAVRDPEEEKAYTELMEVLNPGLAPDSALTSALYPEEALARQELVAVLSIALAEKTALSQVATGGAEDAAAGADGSGQTLAETQVGSQSETPAETEAPEEILCIATNPPAHGEIHYLELGEQDGRIRLYAEDLRKIFPGMRTWSGSTWSGNPTSFEYIIRRSISYAGVIINDGKPMSDGGTYTSFNPDENDFTTILVQDRDLHFCGYSCWHPEKIGEGKWRIAVAECDYDYSAMYEEDREGFKETENWIWIEPDADAIVNSGAAYFTQGYNDTSNQRSENNLKRQMFLIWAGGKDGWFYPMKHFPNDAARFLGNERTRSRYYAFYDQNKKVIGYTDIIGSNLDVEALREKLNARAEN